jgi:hypothetical protein
MQPSTEGSRWQRRACETGWHRLPTANQQSHWLSDPYPELSTTKASHASPRTESTIGHGRPRAASDRCGQTDALGFRVARFPPSVVCFLGVGIRILRRIGQRHVLGVHGGGTAVTVAPSGQRNAE